MQWVWDNDWAGNTLIARFFQDYWDVNYAAIFDRRYDDVPFVLEAAFELAEGEAALLLDEGEAARMFRLWSLPRGTCRRS